MTKCYYKEFSLQLIEQVRLRPLIYDTSEPRSKLEKQNAWKEIADVLNSDYITCRKHWKNVRDRFVKVKHARDKHFNNGGNELSAPCYIFYDKLSFMTDHSISKYMNVQDLSPELLFANPKNMELDKHEGSENTLCIDMTESFINEVKKYPILYNRNAELRKFRSPEVWRKILEALEEIYSQDCKATLAQLRSYWVGLMKKYKLYIKHEESIEYQPDQIENERFFNMLDFVQGEDYQRKNMKFERLDNDWNDEEDTEIIYLEEQVTQYDDDCSNEEIEETEETEEFVNYEIEELNQTEEQNVQETSDDEVETIAEIQSQEETKEEIVDPKPPVLKRIKLSEDFKIVFPPATCPTPKPTLAVPIQVEDEFDHFGKKIAAQLREIGHKNRLIARKAEISVMQLLMQIEESLEC
ncbi:unnamed protein product [Diamesa tonsa]